MKNDFDEAVFAELSLEDLNSRSRIIKSNDVRLHGESKISVEEEAHDSVKLVIKKDAEDNVKEIKFVCSCGQTKSIILDYTDQ